MDVVKLQQIANRAEERATALHIAYTEAEGAEAQNLLNDFFYWIGHANAYKGVVAMIELQAVVDEEVDATPQCP